MNVDNQNVYYPHSSIYHMIYLIVNVFFSFSFLQPAYFGHTGGGTDSERESAVVKNQALAQAGAIVPDTFDSMAVKLA